MGFVEGVVSYPQFLDKVQVRTGLRDVGETERVVRAVLEVVAGQLPDDVRSQILDEVPVELRRILEAPETKVSFASLEDFYQRVHEHEAVPVGFAVEHATTICQTLAEMLEAQTLEVLHRRLEPTFANLFTIRHVPSPVFDTHDTPERRTISSGHPGGLRPLSEAKPEKTDTLSTGRPGGANPIASANNPHPERFRDGDGSQ